MARINRSGFKMKSSPAKGKLDNFFKGLGANLQAGAKKHSDWKDKRAGSDVDKAERAAGYKDHMSKKYGTGDYAASGSKSAERMKAGESKFQYDVRMKKQANTAKRKKQAANQKINDAKVLTTKDSTVDNQNVQAAPLPPRISIFSKTDDKLFPKREEYVSTTKEGYLNRTNLKLNGKTSPAKNYKKGLGSYKSMKRIKKK